jgi:hypothetical protein
MPNASVVIGRRRSPPAIIQRGRHDPLPLRFVSKTQRVRTFFYQFLRQASKIRVATRQES